MVFCLYKHN